MRRDAETGAATLNIPAEFATFRLGYVAGTCCAAAIFYIKRSGAIIDAMKHASTTICCSGTGGGKKLHDYARSYAAVLLCADAIMTFRVACRAGVRI